MAWIEIEPLEKEYDVDTDTIKWVALEKRYINTNHIITIVPEERHIRTVEGKDIYLLSVEIAKILKACKIKY